MLFQAFGQNPPEIEGILRVSICVRPDGLAPSDVTVRGYKQRNQAFSVFPPLQAQRFGVGLGGEGMRAFGMSSVLATNLKLRRDELVWGR